MWAQFLAFMVIAGAGLPSTKFELAGITEMTLSADGKHVFADAELINATQHRYEFVKANLKGQIKKRLEDTNVRAAKISPSGRFLMGINMGFGASSGPNDAVQIYEVQQLALEKTVFRGGMVSRAFWFPKSDKVVFAANDALRVFVRGGQKVSTLKKGPHLPLAVSEDESKIVYTSSGNTVNGSSPLALLDMASGAETNLGSINGSIDQAVFTGAELVFTVTRAKEWSMQSLDLKTGRISQLKQGDRGIAGLRFIPGKRVLMYSLTDGAVGPDGQGVGTQDVMVFDLSTRAEKPIVKNVELWDYSVESNALVFGVYNDALDLRVKKDALR